MEQENVYMANSEAKITNVITEENEKKKRTFICGVIEGFYGRPWTTEQRKDLFRKLKKWGMDSYVYAPKDDYKHRAYWRELYTVEEAEFLSSLIRDAKDHGVTFYYALSPGLDMSYSNLKEIQTLKRKLDQVGHFGCNAFALLFDDIEAELSKADKEVFQTFANAQVSVTNEIYTHMGNPKFLFCPTQYCSSRAMPTVQNSEYLNTLGSKLNQGIDIMWTGNKVISKTITIESIQVITEILRRPPVIWDNLHANDYDQKRVFLGPYCGRSPELIPHLRGVMTNPNCEFHANTVAIHTLACWSQCSLDSRMNSSLAADIKLETETEDGINEDDLTDTVCLSSKKIYHPRNALKNAISEWLPEFFIEKEAWGPITKPQPQVTMVMPIIPIIPSINTCMSLTTTTTTTTSSIKTVNVPEVNTKHLQALADVCSTVDSSAINPISNPVMNSLISPTKVVTNDDILNPIMTTAASNIEMPKKIPVSIVAVPIMHPKTVGETSNDLSANDELVDMIPTTICAPAHTTSESAKTAANGMESVAFDAQEGHLNALEHDDSNKIIEEYTLTYESAPESPTAISENNNLRLFNACDHEDRMECGSSIASQGSPKERKTALAIEDVDMAEESSANDLNISMSVGNTSSPVSKADEIRDETKASEIIDKRNCDNRMGAEDLHLLCDLFYLPFEHGSRGCKLLNEFNWLKANAYVLLSKNVSSDNPTRNSVVKKTLTNDARQLPQKSPAVTEWLQRADLFANLCGAVQKLLKKMANCANKEICHDLFSYVWDIAGTLTLLNAFVKWLSLGKFPQNVYTFTQGTYTWFSKGWKDAFTSGDQEPWVFRGGLTADLQRLMPVDSGNDLFVYKLPDMPTSDCYMLRPYTPTDESHVGDVCTRVFVEHITAPNNDEGNDEALLKLPDCVQDLVTDTLIGPFIMLHPHLCIVAHDTNNALIGYAAAALDVNVYTHNADLSWIGEMRQKYAPSLLASAESFTTCTKINDHLSKMLTELQSRTYQCPMEVSSSYPAVLTTGVLAHTLKRDHGIGKRLLTVMLAMLRANGCFGVHVRVTEMETAKLQYYSKIGFTEVFRDTVTDYVYMGRRF